MAEHIERSVVVRRVMKTKRERGSDGAAAMEIVASAPAADVAPVVHGRWTFGAATENTLSQTKCNICGWRTLDPSVDSVYKYCPICGAEMDGGDSDV